MTRLTSAIAVVAAVAIAAWPSVGAQTPTAPGLPAVDAAFQRFWAAHSPAEAARLADQVVKSGVTFDDAFARLKRGRTYTTQKTGIVMASYRPEKGAEHFYAVNVPASYDPAKSYQVRFQLHGGVGGRDTNQPRGNGDIGALAGPPTADQFYVLPYAWSTAPWWSEDQVQSLATIVDLLKRTYNVDENRVIVSGVSDGGSGAYYLAMRDTTPYASFTPLNGFIMVIANSEIDDGRSYPNNLLNKPMFVVNGGRDRLYPTAMTEPFVLHFKASGADISYHPQPEAGHNTAWWPDLRDIYEMFVADHPRLAHPEKLTWETTGLTHTRAHWLVVDEVGTTQDDARAAQKMKDVNAIADRDELARLNVSAPITIFDRRRPSGRIDAVRKGNTITATARGVAGFTLLLSSDVFDFSQPIKVIVNDRVLYEGRVERNLGTLLRWAARDNDRTMLYGAELRIRVRT